MLLQRGWAPVFLESAVLQSPASSASDPQPTAGGLTHDISGIKKTPMHRQSPQFLKNDEFVRHPFLRNSSTRATDDSGEISVAWLGGNRVAGTIFNGCAGRDAEP
jgi:hypothetical protein